jgi:hypothetical protein
MTEFDGCSDSERNALDQLANGMLVETIDPAIVRSLTLKYLLDDYKGSPILPALVWSQWKKFKEETGWSPHK